MPTWFCSYIRSPSTGERTSLWTQKPTSSCSRGQSARRPLFRGVHDVAAASLSEQPDALSDRPEALVVLGVEHHRRDPEVARRLIARIVPILAAGLAGKRGQQR